MEHLIILFPWYLQKIKNKTNPTILSKFCCNQTSQILFLVWLKSLKQIKP